MTNQPFGALTVNYTKPKTNNFQCFKQYLNMDFIAMNYKILLKKSSSAARAISTYKNANMKMAKNAN